MKLVSLIYVLPAIAFFILGVAISIFLGVEGASFSFGIHPAVDFLALAGGVFVLSIPFFGYLSPLVLLLVGIASKPLFDTNPLAVILLIVPLALAAHAGGLTGRFVHEDMNGKSNLFEHNMQIFKALGAALVVAVVFGIAVDFLPPLDALLAPLAGAGEAMMR